MTLFAAKSLFDGGATIKSYFVQGAQLLDKEQASMHSWSQTCDMEPLDRCIDTKYSATQSNEGHLCLKERQLCASVSNGRCKGISSVLNDDSSVSCSFMKCFDIKFKKNIENKKYQKIVSHCMIQSQQFQSPMLIGDLMITSTDCFQPCVIFPSTIMMEYNLMASHH